MAATDQHYRNQKTLDIVFAVSCVLMLISTIWMLVQDYNREYKAIQREFRDVEATLNRFHAAASAADGATYFSLFAPEGVFIIF